MTSARFRHARPLAPLALVAAMLACASSGPLSAGASTPAPQPADEALPGPRVFALLYAHRDLPLARSPHCADDRTVGQALVDLLEASYDELPGTVMHYRSGCAPSLDGEGNLWDCQISTWSWPEREGISAALRFTLDADSWTLQEDSFVCL